MKLIENDKFAFCHECNKTPARVVQLGQEPDYESSTARICFMCLQKAMMLIADLVKN